MARDFLDITLQDVMRESVWGASGRPEDQGWKELGRCFGEDAAVFYPDRGSDVRPAKAVCALCPVRMPCLAYAVRNGERLGIWGGLTERERRRLRRNLSLSVVCIYCAKKVKAGGLKQQTCNRRECKDKFAAGVEPTYLAGSDVEMEDFEDIEREDEIEFSVPVWAQVYQFDQPLLFGERHPAVRVKRPRCPRKPWVSQGEQLPLLVLAA